MLSYNPRITTKDMVLCLDAANPVSMSPFSSSWIDLSKEKNNGNLANGASYSASNLGAIDFDGNNDYINLENKTLWNSFEDNITVEVFFKLEGSVSDFPRIVSKQLSGLTTSTSCFQLGIYNNSSFRWAVGTENGRIDARVGNVFADEIYHFVGTYDGSSMKAYVNGEQIINESLTGNILTSNQPLTLGLSYFNGAIDYAFPGKIYNVKIYKRALNETEIRQNYIALKNRYIEISEPEITDPDSITTELVMFLDAGNTNSYSGSGSVWNDLTENNINGTLQNSPPFDTNYFTLNGINHGVNIPDTPLINTSAHEQRTVEAWFRTGSDLTDRQIIYEEGGAVNSFVMYIQNGTLYMVGASESYDWDTPTAITTSVSPNTWYSAGFILNATTTTLQPDVFSGFLNGSIIGTGQGSIMAPHSGNITLGYSSDGYVGHDGDAGSGSYFQGDISVYKVYNYALTEAELLINFENLRGRYGI